jgi:hypothetical protein
LDENETSFAYVFERGAFYVKNILRLDFQIAWIAYQDIDERCHCANKIFIPSTGPPGNFPWGISLFSSAFFMETVSEDTARNGRRLTIDVNQTYTDTINDSKF